MTASPEISQTPLMKQYMAIKSKHPDAVLLFRVGDFYETFSQDAVIASKVLGIVLTKRANGSASHIELAGFPHHSIDNYLPKLVRAGYRVAICDQLEDPKLVKGIVKRGVTELVTPGLALNDNVLEQKKNNYLASFYSDQNEAGLALLDLSTGEFLITQNPKDTVLKLLQNYSPAEVLFSKANKEKETQMLSDNYVTFRLDEWIFQYQYGYELLTSHFKTNTLKGFGIENSTNGIIAAGAIMHYLKETEHKNQTQINSLSRIDNEKYVWLDPFTIRNLELLDTTNEKGVSLIDIIDHTQTPMGGRMLKNWVILPLKEMSVLQERQNMVEFLIKNESLYQNITQNLKQISDTERIASKVAVNRANPREIVQLLRCLDHISKIKIDLNQAQNPDFVKKWSALIDTCDFVREKIRTNIDPEAPMLLHQGGIIASGINSDLDELRGLSGEGKNVLLTIQKREIERTGINSLKVAYNKVFGYYIEVSNVHKDKVPNDWIRKQTLVNAERFITEELKVYEEKILNAEEKIGILEQKLYFDLIQILQEFVPNIQKTSKIIASLDCLVSFAFVANQNDYVKPEILESNVLFIEEGRHPVIEKQLLVGEKYVPNDVKLDDLDCQIMIITGPNMAGKSAYLRQTALIVLLAQIGSYVPAKSAKIGLVDKIFSRVGASDNLSKGESTFMVEMNETAGILNNLSEKSLIILDEIGRGTSTYDGISIAWAIVEYLHENKKGKAKTLFATHYHELDQIASKLVRVKNFHVSVKEWDNKVIFLRKMKEGGSGHSFGLNVAQMAGMPNEILIRAQEILSQLEQTKDQTTTEKISKITKKEYQLSLFEANDPSYLKIKEILGQIEINAITPVEALLKLNELKKWSIIK